ncbi:MAG: prolipoprotein diacylglyceryl transferase [Clostridia bacterium]|nr:prolipoprotein diacylglyceryl transferase [Clostridia bacterium]
MVSPGRVAFSIGGVDVMWYGVLIGLGFLLAILISYYRAPKLGIKKDHVLDVALTIIPCAVIGARAYYVLFSWGYYQNHLDEIFSFRHGGLAIHGGLILSFIGVYILCKVKKEDFLNVADLVAPVIALGQAIGRWGNFFNEEAHGGLTDSSLAVVINGQSYYPTFLYESVWCFILFIFLIYLTKHRSFRGQIVLLYGMLYSVERFFVEGLRTDSLMIGFLRQAQVISIAIFIFCLVLYVILKKKKQRRYR